MTGPLETQYGPAVDAAADAAGIPRAALRAIVWIESTWVPTAFLAEQNGDGSYGLCQVTFSTAKSIGFAGQPSDLFDPTTNAQLGAQIFAGALQQAQVDAPMADPLTQLQMAASAYNGGHRPALGFGAPVLAPTTVCLRHDPASGECISQFTAQPGQYGNQSYVDNFTNYFNQEGGGSASADMETLAPIEITASADGEDDPGAADSSGMSSPAFVLAIVAFVLIVLSLGSRSHGV